METKQRYELFLNHISALESFRHPHSFDEYKKNAADMLQYCQRFAFEDDLVEQFKDDEAVKSVRKDEPATMQHLLTAMPDAFVSKGESRKKNKTDKQPVSVWYNVWDVFYITPDAELYYDLFFVYKLRGLDLREMDEFLGYQLSVWYGGDFKKFTRFLQLTIRKHGKLLSPEYIQTISEWVSENGQQSPVEGVGLTVKTKGKVKRERDDNVTRLNQEQTALLIYCLRKTKVILRDENLNNKEAGQAFSLLTGYSADSLRQNLNKSELARLATPKNIEAVVKVANDLQKFIEKEVKPEE